MKGPVYYDPCEGYKDPVLLSETVEPYTCNPRYVKRVTRTYTAYDSKGNEAPECTIIYELLRFEFDDVNCAPDYTVYPIDDACGINKYALSCDGKWRFAQGTTDYDTDLDGDGILDKDVYWDDNDNNYPDPLEVGVPYMYTNINGYMEKITFISIP